MDDGKFTYTWDAENRLASVQPKAPAEKDKKLEFAYDYMGRRILKKVYEYGSGTWTPACDILFIHDGWNLISQIKQVPGQSPEETAFIRGLDLSGTLQEAGGIGGLIAKVDVTANKSYGFFYDANGNIGQMLDTGNGAVKASYEYSPFGSVMKASGDMAQSLEFRFSTKYFDSEPGLYDYGYRYYDPETGRWLSRDPLEEEGGINLYQFVEGDPVNWVDPMGLEIRIYSSDAFGISGLNHAFVYSTETGRFKGTQGSSWIDHGDGRGDLNSRCIIAPLPSGMPENDFMNKITEADGWNNWIWTPFVNDCHSDLENAFHQTGIPYPGAPNGRVDIDDIISSGFKDLMQKTNQLNNPRYLFRILGGY